MNLTTQESYNYKVGGSLAFDHPTYVERQADKDLLTALNLGKFCYVFNCRQMGKSSLRVRAMHQLQDLGMSCASVDITSLGSDLSQKQWYSGIITQLFLGFNLVGKVNLKVWLREREELSGVQKFSQFLEEVLLVHCPGEKVYIFIDEIDKVLSLKFSLDDFFTLIRFFYNQRAENPKFERLVFSLFGVATPSDLIQDKTQTPFNIGQPIELTGFTPEEIEPLAPGLSPISPHPLAVLKAVVNWTGGQPFLTQKLCNLLLINSAIIPPGQEDKWVENFVKLSIIENWESQDEPVHLKTIRDRLFRNEKRAGRLLGMYQQILQQEFLETDESPEQTELRLSGLVVKRNGHLVVYNPIYKNVFNQKWVSKELEKIRPYSEMFTAWLNSNYEDDSRLLRGQALKDALGWAMDKSLSNLDYKYLTESQNLDKREAEFNLAAQQQANEILTQANQKAQRMIRLGIGILAVSLLGATIAFTQAKSAFQKQKEAQMGTQLEQTGDSAWRQFEFEQLEGLVSAMEAGQKLKTLVEDRRLLADYPATSPILALEQILDRIQEKNKLTGHQDAVNSVNFSPDGRWIATASSDGTVRLWDSQGRQKALLTGHEGNIYGVVFSPDSQHIATAAQDDTARVWDLNGKQLAILKGHTASVYSVTFSRDGQRIATTSRDETARIWDLQGRQLAILKGHKKSVDDVAFSPDGQFVATASRDGTAKLWDSQGKLLKSLQYDAIPFYSISFSPDGQLIATGAKDGKIRIWDKQGNLRLTLEGHQELVNSVVFSRDGQWIVSGSSDGTARLWNTQGQEVAILRGHQDPVYDVAINATASRLATASSDGTVKLWELNKANEQGFDTLNNYLTSADFSQDGKLLAIADESGMVYLWNLQGKKIQQFEAHGSGVNTISISPDGQTIATSASNGSVRLWDLQGKLLGELNDNTVRVYSISFSPDGQKLAIANRSGGVWLWNIQKKPYQLIKHFTAHDDSIYQIIFSPDGQNIATGSADGTAKLWDLQGQLLQTFTGHQDRINSLSFSPDGQYFLTASKDSTAKLWNLKGELLNTLKSDLFPISRVAFSPSGDYIITASRDGTVRLWDKQGNLHTKMKGHQESVESLQFSPDNQQILTIARDGMVKVWPVEEEFARLNSLLDQGCHWLHDYLVTRPQEQEKLSSCFNQISEP
ncbi:AAA-like domain-containing protein [Crocosphaera sp. UHCC 0190]|uniref:WD40 domain-containing protein n=1 Tax=Crocosphaera sp. UHCC 0190 TaxID=3110246 RepID=UPI002B1F5F09|nr:AAA-like domain-containing protein [Crocosphaera sp. UHCC 0190]MEA5508371.1 AAA-like domain-containing protein [Crocosphaera sp. UHCC 0190]